MQLSIRDLLPREQVSALWSRVRSAAEPYLARVHTLLGPYWQQGTEWYEKREPREKRLLSLLGAVAVILFIYNAIYQPALGLRDNLAGQVAARQQQLMRVRAMMRTYERLRDDLASTQKRTVAGGKDPALFSVLEMTLTDSVGRVKIGSITPGERPVPGGFEQYTVDVKLNELALPQIVDALYGLQTLKVPITISNFQVRQHARDSHSYDVDLTCMALGKSS
jgi:type II secretory pathway component PulM